MAYEKHNLVKPWNFGMPAYRNRGATPFVDRILTKLVRPFRRNHYGCAANSCRLHLWKIPLVHYLVKPLDAWLGKRQERRINARLATEIPWNSETRWRLRDEGVFSRGDYIK